MTDRELMQQALDLLDDINQCSLPPTGIPLPAEIDHVMEALRARLAQPEQEPVAWELNKVILNSIRDSSEIVAPPQREWQGLTDEEIENFVQAVWPREATSTDYIRAIEAKLKAKNA